MFFFKRTGNENRYGLRNSLSEPTNWIGFLLSTLKHNKYLSVNPEPLSKPLPEITEWERNLFPNESNKHAAFTLMDCGCGLTRLCVSRIFDRALNSVYPCETLNQQTPRHNKNTLQNKMESWKLQCTEWQRRWVKTSEENYRDKQEIKLNKSCVFLLVDVSIWAGSSSEVKTFFYPGAWEQHSFWLPGTSAELQRQLRLLGYDR